MFWPGEFHGLYSPWGHRETDRIEQLSLSWLPKRGSGGGEISSLGLTDTHTHTHTHTYKINNKALLYSTENCIQYLIINYNGKEYKKNIHMCVCVCLTESLCYTPEMNTTLKISYISILKTNINE